MIFLGILCGLIVLMGLWALVNWWRDEQEKLGKRVVPSSVTPSSKVIPAITSRATPLHPSIDPYLSELRAYLLTPPLPQGPGEMAERVYTHLTGWVNTHVNTDTPYVNESAFEDDLLVSPESEPRFVNVSTNEPVPPGYLENLMREE